MFKGYIGMVHYMQAIRADSRGAAGHLVTGRAAVVSQCCDMCLSVCLSVCHVGYLGTAYYTSPELIHVEPCGKPVDIWSLGVLLYIQVVSPCCNVCLSVCLSHRLLGHGTLHVA